MQVNIKSFLIN